MLEKNYHDFVTAHADDNEASPETRELLLHMADKLHEMDLRAGMKSLPPQTPTAGQVKAEADGHASNASRRDVFGVASPGPSIGPGASYVDRIARVCHEANRGYCLALGDTSQPEWNDAPEWQKDSARKGVEMHLDNEDATPQQSHESWLAQKRADGWKYGPVKNPETKEHPCFMPYDGLPIEQRAKDYIFKGVVDGMRETRRVFQSERYFEDKPRQSEEGSWTQSDEDFFQSVIRRLSETHSTQADAILWLTGFYVSGRTEAGEMTDPAVAATNYLRDAGVTIFPESELQPLKTRKPYVAPSIREIPESELTTDQLANLKVDQVTERDPSPGVGSQDPAGRTPVAGSEVLAEPGQNETAGVAS